MTTFGEPVTQISSKWNFPFIVVLGSDVIVYFQIRKKELTLRELKKVVMPWTFKYISNMAYLHICNDVSILVKAFDVDTVHPRCQELLYQRHMPVVF